MSKVVVEVEVRADQPALIKRATRTWEQWLSPETNSGPYFAERIGDVWYIGNPATPQDVSRETSKKRPRSLDYYVLR